MTYGIDYLGGARYPNIILDWHPPGWSAGFFYEYVWVLGLAGFGTPHYLFYRN